jgi:AAA+ superfamily predicted ATPase
MRSDKDIKQPPEDRERRQILAEFVRVTGYHRKHALRVLNQSPTALSPRQRERVYEEAVHQALARL